MDCVFDNTGGIGPVTAPRRRRFLHNSVWTRSVAWKPLEGKTVLPSLRARVGDLTSVRDVCFDINTWFLKPYEKL